MDIGREGFHDTMLLHEHERNPVGQASFLVRTLPVKLKTVIEEHLRDRDHLN